jgi:hypothetical protein
MRRWLSLQTYHWLVLLLAIAAASASLAWNSYQLVSLSMANVGFLNMHRLDAVREGALVQLALILGKGFAALLSYLLFKALEVELLNRWRRWGDGPGA